MKKGFRTQPQLTRKQGEENLVMQVEELKNMNKVLVKKFIALNDGVRQIAESFDVKLEGLIQVVKSKSLMTDEEYDAALKNAHSELIKNKEQIKDNLDGVKDVEDGIDLDSTVIINYEGFIDGKEFQGNKALNHRFKMNCGSVLLDIEKELIGKKAGEKIEVKATFPQNYLRTDLAGKVASFNIEILKVKKSIKEENVQS